MWQLCIKTFFWLLRNPIWASLIKFDPFWTDLIQKIQNKTAIFILFVNVTTFYSIILWSNRNWGKWQTRQQDNKTWQMARSLSSKLCLSLKTLITFLARRPHAQHANKRSFIEPRFMPFKMVQIVFEKPTKTWFCEYWIYATKVYWPYCNIPLYSTDHCKR